MKNVPYGVNRLINIFPVGAVKTTRDGEWVTAVPTPYRKNLFESLCAAWWVLTGRAEAMIWPYDGELEDALLQTAIKNDGGSLFWKLRIAYVRGAEWRHRNGSLEMIDKASYDYADKATSPLPEQKKPWRV